MNSPVRTLSWAVAAVAVGVLVAACTAPPGPPTQEGQPAPRPVTPAVPPGAPSPKPAEPQSEAHWRRALAQHIQATNRERVFEGSPPHPLRAIVVLELTIGADGRLQRATVLRAPDHARELGAEAIRTAQAASPLPPPPRALLARGAARLTETWLFRSDNRFQLRTLAETQRIQ